MAVLSGVCLGRENYSRKLGNKITQVLLLFSTQGWGRGPENVGAKKDKDKHSHKKRHNISQVLFSTQWWGNCGHPT